MGIGGINDYAGLLRNFRVPNVSETGIGQNVRPDAVIREESLTAADTHVAAPVVRKVAQLEDISITFNKQESFGYLGKDSDIHSLDVEKAIDDMRKDKVLQQYQYFVGSSRNLQIENNADGTVIQKF